MLITIKIMFKIITFALLFVFGSACASGVHSSPHGSPHESSHATPHEESTHTTTHEISAPKATYGEVYEKNINGIVRYYRIVTVGNRTDTVVADTKDELINETNDSNPGYYYSPDTRWILGLVVALCICVIAFIIMSEIKYQNR